MNVIKQPPGPPTIPYPTHLGGCRVWAYWLPQGGFELYDYVGVDGRYGIYLFKHRKLKTQLGRTHAQTFYDRSFRPFLINLEISRAQGVNWV